LHPEHEACSENGACGEQIILLPIIYEKNTIEIKENLDKIHNIHYFNFEGNNQESFLIGNENYP
jgi:hypothetical protein